MPIRPDQPWSPTTSPYDGLAGGAPRPSDLQRLMGQPGLRLVPLHRDEPSILDFLPAMGPLMLITPNGCGNSVAWGPICTVLPSGGGTLVGQSERSLHWLSGEWSHSVVVLNPEDPESPPSLLLFGPFGGLAHQVCLTAASDPAALQALIDAHQGCRNCLRHPPAGRAALAAPVEGVGPFLGEAWREAGSPADLETRLEGLGLNRLMAVRALEGLYSFPVALPAFAALLDQLCVQPLRIHLEAGNGSCLQVLEGSLRGVARHPAQWHLHFDEAHLRLDPERLDKLWLVTRPYPDGERRGIEAYGRDQTLAFSLSLPLDSDLAARSNWDALVPGAGLG